MTVEPDPGRLPPWLADQVVEFSKVRCRYQVLGRVLEEIMAAAVKRLAPHAIVQARAKTVASFAEKALRKFDVDPTRTDPLDRSTDLCGVRVIAPVRGQVNALSEYVEAHFEVDRANSVTADQRLAELKPGEFAYRSVHYIVSLDPGADDGRALEEALGRLCPDDCLLTVSQLCDLVAEVQLRTTAEHAWADVAHELSYKATAAVPRRWRRQLAKISAQLEDVDEEFDRLGTQLQLHLGGYGAEQRTEDKERERDLLTLLLDHEPDAALAWRLGKLHSELGAWDAAIEVMEPFVRPDLRSPDLAITPPPLLRDLGMALGKRRRDEDLARGRAYLLQVAEETGDADAFASLAGTYKKDEEDLDAARAFYSKGVRADPTNSYPLGNYLELSIREPADASLIALMQPTLAAALERRRTQAEFKLDSPWVYYDIAKFELLLGNGAQSVRAYAKAVQASTNDWELTASLDSLRVFDVVRETLPGYPWALMTLLAGRVARFGTEAAREQLLGLQRHAAAIRPPVVMLVGGTDPGVEGRMQEFERLLVSAFDGFTGTIVSGGTRQGISGLAGMVSRESRGRIDAVGYLPADPLPADAERDERYTHLRTTGGDGFSALEPLQAWVDLLCLDGFDPTAVRVIGINGGDIAATEYRLALGFGAEIGVIGGTGRAADALLADELWEDTEGLHPLEPTTVAVRAFLGL